MPFKETRIRLWARFLKAHEESLWSREEVCDLCNRTPAWLHAAIKERALVPAPIQSPQLAKRGDRFFKRDVEQFINADWSQSQKRAAEAA